MNNYYVEFTGELKDDSTVQKIFVKQYNRWCDLINSKQQKLNETFDDLWEGDPIEDYSEHEPYMDWMLRRYREILNDSRIKKDILFKYYIDEDLQFYGVGRFGNLKGKKIGFVLKKEEA